MPKAMIYVREPESETIAIDTVHELLKRAYETEFSATYRFGGYYHDLMALASIDFAQRPGANKLMVESQRGDLVIFQDFTHTFANTSDMLSVLRAWNSINVSAYFNFMGLMVSNDEPGAVDFLHEILTFQTFMANWKLPKRPTHEQFHDVLKHMLAKGMGYTAIAKELDRRGFRNSYGKKWYAPALYMWCKRNFGPKENILPSLTKTAKHGRIIT